MLCERSPYFTSHRRAGNGAWRYYVESKDGPARYELNPPEPVEIADYEKVLGELANDDRVARLMQNHRAFMKGI